MANDLYAWSPSTVLSNAKQAINVSFNPNQTDVCMFARTGEWHVKPLLSILAQEPILVQKINLLYINSYILKFFKIKHLSRLCLTKKVVVSK